MHRLDFARPRSLVVGAVLAGIIAGLLAATYMRIVAEPLVDEAIAIEDARIAAQPHHAAEPEQVSRNDQKGAGLFIGYALLGAAYALITAVTALALRGPWLDPFRRIGLSAAILAGTLTVSPWIKYPPNPPAVGDPATAGERQQLYWLLVVLTGLGLAGLAHLSGRLRRADWDQPRRIALVAAVGLMAFGLLMVLLPGTPDAIAGEVPALLVWRFRLVSLGGNLLLWGLIGVGFGALCAEAAKRVPATATADDQNSIPLRAEIPLS